MTQCGERLLGHVVANFTPVPRDEYRLGVPEAGARRTVLDTDAACYGGSNYGDGAPATAKPGPRQEDLPASLALNLPPLATLILRLDGSYNAT
jgi:1,4-alpha-glucan branching enzyme